MSPGPGRMIFSVRIPLRRWTASNLFLIDSQPWRRRSYAHTNRDGRDKKKRYVYDNLLIFTRANPCWAEIARRKERTGHAKMIEDRWAANGEGRPRPRVDRRFVLLQITMKSGGRPKLANGCSLSRDNYELWHRARQMKMALTTIDGICVSEARDQLSKYPFVENNGRVIAR